MKMISLADLKSMFDSTLDVAFDTQLNEAIEYYSDVFQTETNRLWKKEVRTKRFNGGRKLYFLPAIPIDLIQTFTVKVDGSAMTKDADYFVDDERGIVAFLFTTSTLEPLNVEITWVGGFDEVDVGAGEMVVQVPSDIKGALRRQCRYAFRTRDKEGMASVNMPDGSITVFKPGEYLPDFRRVIDKYRFLPTEV